MELKDVQRRREKKTKRLNLKLTDRESKWLTENNVSPQKVLDKALEKLMSKKK